MAKTIPRASGPTEGQLTDGADASEEALSASSAHRAIGLTNDARRTSPGVPLDPNPSMKSMANEQSK